MIEAWRKFVALRPEDRRLLLEAAALLGVIRIGLRLLPFAVFRRALTPSPRSLRWPWNSLSADPPTRRSAGVRVPERVSWAIGVLTRRLPGPTTCLAQALAADALLRRRGLTPELHIGVREPAPTRQTLLDAHAWVECDGQVVVGELANLAAYEVLSAPGRP